MYCSSIDDALSNLDAELSQKERTYKLVSTSTKSTQFRSLELDLLLAMGRLPKHGWGIMFNACAVN